MAECVNKVGTPRGEFHFLLQINGHGNSLFFHSPFGFYFNSVTSFLIVISIALAPLDLVLISSGSQNGPNVIVCKIKKITKSLFPFSHFLYTAVERL